MAKLKIDGRELTVPDNITILDAARRHGFHIPTLCHHPKLTPFGGCRLCIVSIKDIPKPLASCTTIVSDGMEILTSTPELEDLRKLVLELILSDHPNDCMLCEKTGSCTLQDLAYAYGIRNDEFAGERRVYEKRDGNPFVERDLEKCILCGRCVKVCDEVQGVEAIDFGHRGFGAKICTNFEEDLDCEFCGQCISVCPTGALTGKTWKQKGRLAGASEVDTVCPYCGTGCNITAHVSKNEIVKISSGADTWNEGWLCVKGRFGSEFVNSPDRLKKPLIRINDRDKSSVTSDEPTPKDLSGGTSKGKGESSEFNGSNPKHPSIVTDQSSLFMEVSWDEALNFVASKLRSVKEKSGPDAIGGLSSARCTNEENYAFQKFMRAAIGTNNVDHCARL
jgi:predicted molibdopterin-dependent oxidoreductase YjgC